MDTICLFFGFLAVCCFFLFFVLVALGAIKTGCDKEFDKQRQRISELEQEISDIRKDVTDVYKKFNVTSSTLIDLIQVLMNEAAEGAEEEK